MSPQWTFRVWMFGGWRARRAYLAAGARSGVVYREFVADKAADAFARAHSLFEWSEVERTMSANAHGFAGSARRDEDGFTLAASHENAAIVLGLVASSEYCLYAQSKPLSRPMPIPGLSERAAAVVDALCVETEVDARGVLVRDLCFATADQFGGQAAEALAALAVAYFQLAGMTRDDAWRRVWPDGGDW